MQSLKFKGECVIKTQCMLRSTFGRFESEDLQCRYALCVEYVQYWTTYC